MRSSEMSPRIIQLNVLREFAGHSAQRGNQGRAQWTSLFEKIELRVQGEQGGEHSQNTVIKEERSTQRKQSPEVCRGSSHVQYLTEYCSAQVCEETPQGWGPSEGFQAIVHSKQCLFPDCQTRKPHNS